MIQVVQCDVFVTYFCPTNEKHSNDETLPSPTGSLSTFSLSFNIFYSNSSRKLFHKEGDEMKSKIAISYNFDSRATISSGKEQIWPRVFI